MTDKMNLSHEVMVIIILLVARICPRRIMIVMVLIKNRRTL